MNTLTKLSNGLVIAIIGNAGKLIFDDNNEIQPWINSEPELSVLAGIPEFAVVNDKQIMVCKHGRIELSTWVKREIDNFVIQYVRKEIHIILCDVYIASYVLDYITIMYPDVSIYLPKIFEFNEEGTPICKIDSFIQYDKIQINKSTI